jgi:hypothetical protein
MFDLDGLGEKSATLHPPFLRDGIGGDINHRNAGPDLAATFGHRPSIDLAAQADIGDQEIDMAAFGLDLIDQRESFFAGPCFAYQPSGRGQLLRQLEPEQPFILNHQSRQFRHFSHATNT